MPPVQQRNNRSANAFDYLSKSSQDHSRQPSNGAANVVSKYESQRLPTTSAPIVLSEGQEQQYIEEEYYIEEEVEEEGEEETQTQGDGPVSGVETIKEVSSEQENQSPGCSEPNQYEMGTIMRTASLSAEKNRHYSSTQFSKSQKGITASDFKDF